MQKPPPFPAKRNGLPWAISLLLVTTATLAVVFFLLIFTGRLRSYSIPTDGMKPAISRGDIVVMEGVTYLFRSPRPGEIVVYRSDGLQGAPLGQFYVQRVAGKPGDVLRISDGKLFVNDKRLTLANSSGEISYVNMSNSRFLNSSTQSVTVPDGHYFLLGDNSSHSFDGRFLGYVPARSIRGRIIMRQ